MHPQKSKIPFHPKEIYKGSESVLLRNSKEMNMEDSCTSIHCWCFVPGHKFHALSINVINYTDDLPIPFTLTRILQFCAIVSSVIKHSYEAMLG